MVFERLARFIGYTYLFHIRNNFLEYRAKQATLFAQRNDFYALFAPVVTQFLVKV